MLREKALKKLNRLVIKVGSKILVDWQGEHSSGIRREYLEKLADSIVRIQKKGIEVVLVSSGAVGAGMASLGIQTRPKEAEQRQALASVGQGLLMEEYNRAFAPFGVPVGQILLTADAFRIRERYMNIKNTVDNLLEMGCVPIINENDSVVVNEIKVGDNDKLSADVAQFLSADLLIIFTDEEGLYDKNPKTSPDAQLIKEVAKVDEKILGLAEGGRGSEISTGGMQTKLDALHQATDAGCAAVLAHGQKYLPHQIVEGEEIGTFFAGAEEQMPSRERWITHVSRPLGWLEIDSGAVRALREEGASLLLNGVQDFHGHFRKGDLLEVRNRRDFVVARGVAECDSVTLKKLLSLTAPERKLLEKKERIVIHRNNLVLKT